MVSEEKLKWEHDIWSFFTIKNFSLHHFKNEKRKVKNKILLP